jgi:hypothetical protein
MSLRATMSSIPPPFVAAAGAAVLAVLPLALAATATSSLILLKGANSVAFALNCAAVSVPGRIDGEQDQDMRSGALDPSKPAATHQSET